MFMILTCDMLSGHLAVVKILLEHGADTESYRNNGWSVLAVASQNDQIAIIELVNVTLTYF